MDSNTKTVAFFGASTGVGLSALKHTLAAGQRCIALCRHPAKLTAIISPQTTPNLRIVQGNAHDITAVSKCLQAEDGKLVDVIVSTIGSKLVHMSVEDPQVCGNGMETLLKALAELRRKGVEGSPHIIVGSTTGISRFGRDLPLAMVPVYRLLGKVPHQDKIVMEDKLMASGESYTIMRASLLTDGETTKPIRVGVEDPKKGSESRAIGYTISREDAGRWVAENLVLKSGGIYKNKIAVITY